MILEHLRFAKSAQVAAFSLARSTRGIGFGDAKGLASKVSGLSLDRFGCPIVSMFQRILVPEQRCRWMVARNPTVRPFECRHVGYRISHRIG